MLAPAGALALGPQAFSGYTGTNPLPHTQRRRLWGGTGHLQTAGPGRGLGERGTCV